MPIYSGNEGDCLWLEFHPWVKAETIQEETAVNKFIHIKKGKAFKS